MAAYNAGMYIGEAIESVLKQSFSAFELILVDDGSTDNTGEVIRSYADSRIKLIKNGHDYIGSLNTGLATAKGKYIARMDSDNIMHIDRLKIQYAVMEEEPDITVCGSWVSPFGENIPKGNVSQTIYGMIDCPLLLFMKENFIFHPTTMIRSGFLWEHSFRYEKYECGEDYKLWVEITKKGGNFYVETQPLLYYRVSEQQVSDRKREAQKETSSRIKKEILNYLMQLNSKKYTGIEKMAEALLLAKEEGLMDDSDIFSFFCALYVKNKNILSMVIK